ncbi:hypothetical protein ACFW04_008297 [Cataglyphis niger]
MKILVLVTCLLAISFAADPQKLKKVYNDYTSCLEELNEQQWTPEVVKCYFQKDGLLDEQGVLTKETLFAILDKIISDENDLNQAKELGSTCLDQAYQGPGNNNEKLMAYIHCAMHITDLLDKLQ